MNKQNVLVICVDHWPGKLLNYLGKSDIYTPTLDQLCKSGVTYDNAYSSTPTCIPARRSLFTGLNAENHGDRIFNQELRMPEVKTMPTIFKENGYQTFAVGKLHVFPQRDRIGFDDALINEEGRHHLGNFKDDYEQYLTDNGLHGEEYTHGMSTNDYSFRSWHLEEKYHPTYWTTKEICRMIQRRDPSKPGFWYVSYVGPHPPVTPIKDFMDLYKDIEIEEPSIGSWLKEEIPYALQAHMHLKYGPTGPKAIEKARKAFYAQCSYIDSQIRLLIGTLREENLLEDTIILFTSDHGDMLGEHNMWAKPTMFDSSSKIPMIIVPSQQTVNKTGFNRIDSKFVYLRDVLPTLLDMCDIELIDNNDGLSMIKDNNR